MDTAQKGTSVTGNVLLQTHLYPSVWVLRAYPFPEVWLPGLGASLEIVQLREAPLLLATMDRALQKASGEASARADSAYPRKLLLS